jgi:hypothetical protein
MVPIGLDSLSCFPLDDPPLRSSNLEYPCLGRVHSSHLPSSFDPTIILSSAFPMPATRTRTTRALARSAAAAATPSPVKVKVKAEDILPKLEEKSTSLQSPQKTKKLKLVADYTSSSPFPEWKHPTPEEARAVHGVLSNAHPQYVSSKNISPDEANNAARTCGKGENRASHVSLSQC